MRSDKIWIKSGISKYRLQIFGNHAFHGMAHRRASALVEVLCFGHSYDALKEFESAECIIIVHGVIYFLEVGSDEYPIDVSLRQSFVVDDAPILAHGHKIQPVDRWIRL